MTKLINSITFTGFGAFDITLANNQANSFMVTVSRKNTKLSTHRVFNNQQVAEAHYDQMIRVFGHSNGGTL